MVDRKREDLRSKTREEGGQEVRRVSTTTTTAAQDRSILLVGMVSLEYMICSSYPDSP